MGDRVVAAICDRFGQSIAGEGEWHFRSVREIALQIDPSRGTRYRKVFAACARLRRHGLLEKTPEGIDLPGIEKIVEGLPLFEPE